MAGLWCVNIGYGNEEMADALRAQVARLAYYHSFSSMANDVSTLLAARLVTSAPVPMAQGVLRPQRLGRQRHRDQDRLVLQQRPRPARKKKIISRYRGYHGVTALTAGLTGLDNLHDGFDLPLPMIRHTRAPHRLWDAEPGMTDAEFSAALAADLEELILAEDPDTVAAFIAEPIQAAGGVIVPPTGYFAAIEEVLRRYDILLIADEVVCAFGRLGRWFGTEVFGLQPDLITLAKGITSAYVPLSASLVSARVWEVLSPGQRAVRRARPRLHLLRAPGGGRGRAHQPRHHRPGGAGRAGRQAGRLPAASGCTSASAITRWSARSAGTA